ncbi:MAG TPA: peptidase domain-containing ABC transporter [Polyangiales bacterium]|nr:peptidase domain-containing ABC transporter [Polyangiales bacterium]
MNSATARTRTREVAFVPQLTETDCGAACLASVLSFHGKHVPLHEVRSRLGGGRNGVTARQLLAAGRAYGLTCRGVAIEPTKLKFLPAGSILHWDLAHYVVYEGANAKSVQIVDPATGRRNVAWDDANKSISGVALVFEPGDNFVKVKPERRQRLRRYASWIFGVRNVWMRIIVASFFMQLLSLAIPGLMTTLVDKVVPRGDAPLLYLVGAGFLVLTAFHFMSALLRSRLLLELRTRVESRMSFFFVEHLFALPYAFFQQRTTGDLMMRLSSQAAIRELLTTGALSALLDGVLVSLYFVLLIGAAPSLAYVAIGFALMQVLVYAIGARRNAQLVVEGLAAQAQLEATQVEMLAGMETLKSMGATDRALSRWSDLYVNTLNRSIARGLLDGTFSALLGTLRFAGPVCLMLMGAYKVLDGTLSLGSMLGLSTLGAGFLDPVANLVATSLRLTQLHGYMERIEDVLETPRERASADIGNLPVNLSGAISLRQVAFKYPSEPEPTLTDVSFEAAPGECVAIVGASGSGKSTLARLLAGLYEPSEGSISFDGRDLRGWDLTRLRKRLGIVTQDTRLFAGTIRDNVSLFDNDVNQDEIERACRLACIHETIEAMPMGYDTVLADGGSSLSGGQRQRLSLARALLLRPSVLVLDEATSALDTVTERRVQEELRRLECTRVIVAHRLSTIVEADKILMLDNGRIVGLGRHDGLLKSCPAYRHLVLTQTSPEHAPSAGPATPPTLLQARIAPATGNRVNSLVAPPPAGSVKPPPLPRPPAPSGPPPRRLPAGILRDSATPKSENTEVRGSDCKICDAAQQVPRDSGEIHIEIDWGALEHA